MTLAPGHIIASLESGLALINTGMASKESTSIGPLIPIRLLSLQTSQQQQHLQQQQPFQLKSPPLSWFKQEAIRTCGRPWSSHPALGLSENAWYPAWFLYHRMGEKKRKVVRHLEFCGSHLLFPSLLPLPPYPSPWSRDPLPDTYVDNPKWQHRLLSLPLAISLDLLLLASRNLSLTRNRQTRRNLSLAAVILKRERALYPKNYCNISL